jgi:hypothetical protein
MKRHEAYMKQKLEEENERAGKEAYGNVVVDMVNSPPHYNSSGI